MVKGDRKGQFSLRINEKYRICFRWQNDGAENVEIVDYH
jgi:proteic killer suppression protein